MHCAQVLLQPTCTQQPLAPSCNVCSSGLLRSRPGSYAMQLCSSTYVQSLLCQSVVDMSIGMPLGVPSPALSSSGHPTCARPPPSSSRVIAESHTRLNRAGLCVAACVGTSVAERAQVPEIASGDGSLACMQTWTATRAHATSARGASTSAVEPSGSCRLVAPPATKAARRSHGLSSDRRLKTWRARARLDGSMAACAVSGHQWQRCPVMCVTGIDVGCVCGACIL